MTKLVDGDPELPPEQALSEALRTCNHREMFQGFSPVQHVLGKAPDETGRFIHSLTGNLHEQLLANPSTDFRSSIEHMKQAEQALSEWQAKQRIQRAINSRAQREYHYRPGDLVYFWRKQIKQPGIGKNGAFLGPARILCTETRREPDGQLRPGSAIWCVRGRRLLKCSPEQLRPASHREELLEHLTTDDDKKAPWTFPRITQELGGNAYEDISKEIPDLEEWHRAQDTDMQPTAPAGLPPPRVRHSQKRPVSPGPDPSRSPFERPGGEAKASRTQNPDTDQDMDSALQTSWWNQVEEHYKKTNTQGEEYWSEQDASIEIEITFPESKRGKQEALADMTGYIATQLKRRAVEVVEKYLTPAERQQFQEAKGVEVTNYIAARAFEALPEHLRPPAEQAIGMRWILTWKLKDDGTYKAKARAILKGYQDPGYEHRATTTPVMTRQTRQILLHLAAQNRWTVKKGDVSGAFLQGREYPTPLYCIPCKEITDAMGLQEGEIVQIKRGCYGLVDAPLEWYRSVSETFGTLGLTKSWADPCCWLWKPNGVLRGMIAGHVDDFLFTGSKDDREWLAIEQAIQTKYKWGTWESGKFVQCGVTIEETPQGGFALSQPQYLDKVSELNLNATRRREKNLPTTDFEKTKLRGILGALSWHAQQVAPHFSAEVGLMLSEISTSTVETICRVNHLLQKAKSRKDHKLLIHAFPENTKTGLFVWADASGQNRPDGGSTQGIFIGIAPLGLLQGKMECVSPIGWHASKIDRVTRSPGAAEAKAVVTGEDLLFHARFQLGETLGETDVFDIDATVNRVDGCLISDSRNVFDKLTTEELSTKGAERRTDLELLCVKSAQRHNHVILRWVHSEAQLGNALTKGGAKELELFYRGGQQWKIVSDQQMQSARKRRQNGQHPLDEPVETQKKEEAKS